MREGSELIVYSPYDRREVGRLPLQSAEEVRAARDRAVALYRDRSTWLPLHERIAILKAFGKRIEEAKEEIIKEAILEGGKPFQDTKVEVERSLSGIDAVLSSAYTLKGEQIPMGATASSEGRIAFTLQEPLGPLLAISAFNHPVNLIMHQALPALITGCPLLLRPASTTPLSAQRLLSLLHEAGLPSEWAELLICNHDALAPLIQDPEIRFLHFIGSAEVGWKLKSTVAKTTHTLLEHGGAAPLILAPDADLERALPAICKGAFYHAGQVCVSLQRLFFHTSQKEKLLDALTARMQKLKVGDPLDPATEVGPLIEPSILPRLSSWVEEAVQGGATLLCGGTPISETLFQPTLLLNPPQEAKVSCEEIFGPVLCLYSYEKIEEAIERANRPPFTFQAALFGQDIDQVYAIAKGLKACAVIINDHTAFRADWMPFGGAEESGWGMGGYPYTIKDLLFSKLVVMKLNP